MLSLSCVDVINIDVVQYVMCYITTVLFPEWDVIVHMQFTGGHSVNHALCVLRCSDEDSSAYSYGYHFSYSPSYECMH